MNTLNAQFLSTLFTSGGDIFISAQWSSLPSNHFDSAKWAEGKSFKILGVSLGFTYLYYFFFLKEHLLYIFPMDFKSFII